MLSLVMCDLMNISYSCRLVVIKYVGQRLLLLLIIHTLTGVNSIVI